MKLPTHAKGKRQKYLQTYYHCNCYKHNFLLSLPIKQCSTAEILIVKRELWTRSCQFYQVILYAAWGIHSLKYIEHAQICIQTHCSGYHKLAVCLISQGFFHQVPKFSVCQCWISQFMAKEYSTCIYLKFSTSVFYSFQQWPSPCVTFVSDVRFGIHKNTCILILYIYELLTHQ